MGIINQGQTSLSTKVNRIVFSKTVPILRESNRFILEEDSELLNIIIIIVIFLNNSVCTIYRKCFIKGIQSATASKIDGNLIFMHSFRTGALFSLFLLILPTIQSLKYFGERMSSFTPESLSMGILQLSVSSDKNANILLASQEIDKAAKASAELLVDKNF